MTPERICITGGCGFVGSSLALRFKGAFPSARIVCLDNLKRRGSELNITRLRRHGIEFLHGDIRSQEDVQAVGDCDLLVECSAEPSVLAGYGSSPQYLVNTNLVGTLNCLELARQRGAVFLFLSTSRVYPYRALDALRVHETDTRFVLQDAQDVPGAGSRGIAEDFPLHGARSLYGATKLASEIVILEYVEMYGVPAIINRCGVLAGPWQFGKVDQGVVVLWVARHYWRKPLSYIGYGGVGKQVRDILHVDDLYGLLEMQLDNLSKHNGQIYNVGGGRSCSISLMELTGLCERATGKSIRIASAPENRPADVRCYLSDTRKVRQATGWNPTRSPESIVEEIAAWIRENERMLEPILR